MGIVRYWPLIVGLLATVAFLVWLDGQKDASKTQGVEQERAASNEGVITDVQESKAAIADVLDGRSDAKYYQCLRSARTPENCTRFLPVGHPDYGKYGEQPVNP